MHPCMHFVWSLEMHRPSIQNSLLFIWHFRFSILVLYSVFFWRILKCPGRNSILKESEGSSLYSYLSWSKVLSFVSKMTFNPEQLETYKMARKFDTCLVAMKFNLRTLHKLLFLLTTTNFNDCGNTTLFSYLL